MDTGHALYSRRRSTADRHQLHAVFDQRQKRRPAKLPTQRFTSSIAILMSRYVMRALVSFIQRSSIDENKPRKCQGVCCAVWGLVCQKTYVIINQLRDNITTINSWPMALFLNTTTTTTNENLGWRGEGEVDLAGLISMQQQYYVLSLNWKLFPTSHMQDGKLLRRKCISMGTLLSCFEWLDV